VRTDGSGVFRAEEKLLVAEVLGPQLPQTLKVEGILHLHNAQMHPKLEHSDERVHFQCLETVPFVALRPAALPVDRE
jgi:hypothetical protein